MSVEAASSARAWPFEEARKLLARLEGTVPDKGYALFETGYGPSGLPHIGTFGEVARTAMVRRAFAELSDMPTRLFAFSDDMDGLRRAPDNVPNGEALKAHLGKPLTSVPDPFGTHESFGAHNNARLCAFLDRFGFDYEFVSATGCYRPGPFLEALLGGPGHSETGLGGGPPPPGPAPRQTYSPFLPVCPETGVVLQVPILHRDPDAGTVVYADEAGRRVEQPVTGGQCKLQWKADWAMRWRALDVDYEMAGKDLIDSVRLSGRICRALGGRPPEGFIYELFLDERGEKISKSRGNGLSIEEWLTYAPEESLALFMFQKPKAAKRLYFDVIPRAVDDYRAFLERAAGEEEDKQLENPAWHIHAGAPPAPEEGISFSLLLNLAAASDARDKGTLWGFISRYDPEATPETRPKLDRLADFAIAYCRDFVAPEKVWRDPEAKEAAALADLADRLAALPRDADGETVQEQVYAVGKAHGFEPLRAWFSALYEVLLGRKQGPRFGSFAALYGLAETEKMIRSALARNAA
ncbi:MAG: lysine--tRNA ligase [Alphaproteobacteria bacterium]|nr:lysine--tRNA ligase [Alphaproteobacteria bacterium]